MIVDALADTVAVFTGPTVGNHLALTALLTFVVSWVAAAAHDSGLPTDDSPILAESDRVTSS